MPRKPATKPHKGLEPSGHGDSDLVALALVALAEVTGADTFVQPPKITRKEGVVDVAFVAAMAGYPGWSWTVTLADIAGIDPTVLELELLPGEGALLSPAWVPWADRLEEYLVLEKDAAETLASNMSADSDESEGDDDPDEDSEDTDDDDDDDDDDFDDDVDGVDIDQLDLDLDPPGSEISVEPNGFFDQMAVEEADPLDP